MQDISHTLPLARHQPQLLIQSARTINPEKTKNPEMRSNFKQIVLDCLGQHTQNPGLTEIDLEARPKTGYDKINLQKQKRNSQNKASHIVQPGFTYGSKQLQVDLEPSAKRGTDRTRALVSLY